MTDDPKWLRARGGIPVKFVDKYEVYGIMERLMGRPPTEAEFDACAEDVSGDDYDNYTDDGIDGHMYSVVHAHISARGNLAKECRK